jgi:hypothetical protein
MYAQEESKEPNVISNADPDEYSDDDVVDASAAGTHKTVVRTMTNENQRPGTTRVM